MKREIPNHWVNVKLSDICLINPKNEVKDNLEVSFVPMASVDADTGTIEKSDTKLWSKVKKGYTHFKNGDVIFAKISPCMENGKCVPVNNLINGFGAGSTEFHVARPVDGINQKYIWYYLRWEKILNEATNKLSGSVNQRRLSTDHFKNIEIPLPPKKEQERIVSRLDQIFINIESNRMRLIEIAQAIKDLRKSIYAKALSGELTKRFRKDNKLPDPTERRIEELIIELKYGTSKKCNRNKEGTPILRIPNITDCGISASDLKYTKLNEAELESIKLQEGDILLIRSNGSVSLVGKSAIVSKPFINYGYAGYLIRIRPDKTQIIPDFLNHALGSHDIRVQIEVPARSTSGVNNINSTEVKSLIILSPHLSEQQEILKTLNIYEKFIKEIEGKFYATLGQMNLLPHSILKKAFSGKLVNQIPEEENASSLLKQIQYSIEAIMQTKTKKKVTKKKKR